MWLSYHYGKADHCDNPDCNHDSDYFDWSLIHGKKYERKRESFFQLCRKCHAKYDERGLYQSEETREKIRKAMMGNKHLEGHIPSEKTRKILSEKFSGKNNPMYGRSAYVK